jgi:hypothetical protein
MGITGMFLRSSTLRKPRYWDACLALSSRDRADAGGCLGDANVRVESCSSPRERAAQIACFMME